MPCATWTLRTKLFQIPWLQITAGFAFDCDCLRSWSNRATKLPESDFDGLRFLRAPCGVKGQIQYVHHRAGCRRHRHIQKATTLKTTRTKAQLLSFAVLMHFVICFREKQKLKSAVNCHHMSLCYTKDSMFNWIPLHLHCSKILMFSTIKSFYKVILYLYVRFTPFR